MSDIDVEENRNNNNDNNDDDLVSKNSKPKENNEEQSNKSKRVVFQENPVILNNKLGLKSCEPTLPSKAEVSENEKNREKKERLRPPTKVVVRRLPPSMTLETFVDNVSPLPEHDYIYFVKADLNLGPNAFSRAYINFVNMTDLLTFHEQFDNYVFMDNKGNEYPAVVEFAPFQRVPKKRIGRKKDPKCGTLKDDPAYIAFVASLQEKKEASTAKQTSAEHLLALTTENSAKKEVTTPLIEFLKQRRAERQRMRDEKREERKRKELERKRIKDEERRRRKDSDSVLKVLRNPDHEDKEDVSKGTKERDRERERQPLGTRKRDDERPRNRDKDKKDRQLQENRQRDVKGRDNGPKSYREERQKQGERENRLQRKGMEDQRKKPGMDRGPSGNKLSDTRRSQELDFRKLQAHPKDVDQKKPYGERYQSHGKDGERHSRELEPRKNYRDMENRRSDRNLGYTKDFEHRKGGYGTERKYSHNYSDPDQRRRQPEYKLQIKPDNQKHNKDTKMEGMKSLNMEDNEERKWKLLGAKPKMKQSQESDIEERLELKEEMNTEDKTESNDESREIILKRRNSVDSLDIKQDLDSVNPYSSQEGDDIIQKRRSSLESVSPSCQEKQYLNLEMFLKEKCQISLDPEVFMKETQLECARKSIPVSKSQEFEKSPCTEIEVIHKRRNSLDSGDHDMSTSSNLAQLKENHTSDQQEGESQEDTSATETENKARCSSQEKEGGDGNRDEANMGEVPERKRDPRVERRIRNKDRPSIEIYRPGMGRFSMQRKEREKGVGSSTEQESPSTSPSPSPSGRASKSSKLNQELRSLTFKRSVSREK